ncbi:6-hydroxymethylpterin diphosphokinase MptE-like protein [Arcobacter vandammei]|uniref:6-hydroxymethylpterin diphosphokinase MptE-like protein n=1 Tax=Arcobacter vandammei TaxID=2782243 RepID=UPI0018DF42E8|nr:6-hydroxymethylpterin diphosphokinase MptE-like protein [Arcobacter vandammei]
MTQTKEQAQIQLQNALTTTFLANLAFLSEYDNELYHRVDELSRMIENGTYKEKYALDFIMEDGDFDIYDIVNDKYLYDRKPKKKNDDLVRKVEFDSKQAIIDFPEQFYINKKINYDRSNKFHLNSLEELNNMTYSDISEYTSYLKTIYNDKKTFKRIDKFIFIGTLLGRHIPRIAEKINASSYLVLERNLEIFRLSLFTVDYTILAKKGMIFSIMDNTLDEEKRIETFLNISKFDNYMLKFSTTSINVEQYIDKILSIKQGLSSLLYDYNRRNYIFINRSTKYIPKYNILQFNQIKNTCDIFKNHPILYIAAGPSLDDNLEWIKRNQNKFYIITIGSAYEKLINEGIRLDAIATLDEQELLEVLQFSDNSVSKINKNTVILASILTNEKILKKFSQESLFLYEPYIPFYKDNISFGGYSIGEFTLNLILQFNPSEIYIIGLDLAVNQDTGESHFKSANSGLSKFDLSKSETRETFTLKDNLIKVKGNLKNEVFTTPLFYISLKEVEKAIAISKSSNTNLNIFNISAHGSYFNGTIPIKVDLINIDKYKDINKLLNLRVYLKNYSMKGLDKDSIEKLKIEISFLNTKINTILDDIYSNDFLNYKEFYEKIIEIPIQIFENNFLMFYQIIFEYYSLYIPYFTYYFNDTKIKEEKKKINKIKEIFIRQISQILNDYVYCLERLVK